MRDTNMHSTPHTSGRKTAGSLSHASIVSKWLDIIMNFFLGLDSLPLWFSNTTL